MPFNPRKPSAALNCPVDECGIPASRGGLLNHLRKTHNLGPQDSVDARNEAIRNWAAAATAPTSPTYPTQPPEDEATAKARQTATQLQAALANVTSDYVDIRFEDVRDGRPITAKLLEVFPDSLTIFCKEYSGCEMNVNLLATNVTLAR